MNKYELRVENATIEVNESVYIERRNKTMMTKAEILEVINSNGGFDNFMSWNREEIETWVFHNYPCTRRTAKQVAIELAY